MNEKTELVSAVYDAINEIGKHKIRSDVISDIKFADQYMQLLFDRASEKLDNKLDSNSMITMYETLLHFMLTACTIPSQRKVKISHLVIDLVIPNIHTLSRNPSNVILVQFIRDDKDLAKVDEILSLFNLKNEELNIWLITTSDLDDKHSIRVINIQSPKIKSLYIINNIDAFLKVRRDKSFRLVHF